MYASEFSALPESAPYHGLEFITFMKCNFGPLKKNVIPSQNLPLEYYVLATIDVWNKRKACSEHITLYEFDYKCDM